MVKIPLSIVPSPPPHETPAVMTPPRTLTVAEHPMNVRISSELIERLREASHRLRRKKKDIMAEALHEWLRARGM